ncbi:hypothetical protein ACFXJ8_13955 [Nonomuraea sp. NPDC059194]|uniref:hypothetical protein n=1 Tax=Nonomuraea sp. NPDC059194 TaxID=3346764 RepID=UPI0036CCD80B
MNALMIWACVYAVTQVGWILTGTPVVWAMQETYPPVVHLLLAALAVLAALAGRARQGGRVVMATFAVALAAFATGTAGAPMIFVTLMSLEGVASVPELAQVVLNAVGAVLLLRAAVPYGRRLRGRCPACGGRHEGEGPLTHPVPTRASARTRVAVYALMCGLLPWAGVKTIWLLGGDALGVSSAAWQRVMAAEKEGVSAALASAGIDVTVLAALLGVFLLTGLMYRWGQVFPRWTPVLAGRRVPRLLPLIPAWLTAGTLSVYGVLLICYTALTAIGVLPGVAAVPPFSVESLTWMMLFGGLAFAGLGIGLIVAAVSYARRSLPFCAPHHVLQGPAPAPTTG